MTTTVGRGGDGDAPRKTWAAAKEHCESLGASLAVITSAGQNAEAMAVMASRGLDDAWIGLTDLALEGTYVWLDTSISSVLNSTTPVSYFAWAH